jgi:hypothetical protein
MSGKRYLKISWTILCGLAAVLLIVVWVRSYRLNEVFFGPVNNSILAFGSTQGKLSVMHSMRQPLPHEAWHYDGTLINESEDMWAPSWHAYYSFLGIGLRIEQRVWLLAIPHWCFVASCAAFSMLPWLAWRFSLRTLLLATTLVGLVLGFAAWAMR